MISNLEILRDQATTLDPKVLTLQISDLSRRYENRLLVYGKSQKHLHTLTVKHTPQVEVNGSMVSQFQIR